MQRPEVTGLMLAVLLPCWLDLSLASVRSTKGVLCVKGLLDPGGNIDPRP